MIASSDEYQEETADNSRKWLPVGQKTPVLRIYSSESQRKTEIVSIILEAD
jgi:hypothetical protein